MEKASARRAVEIGMRMNLLPNMAVSSEALEERVLSELSKTPTKKRKYNKTASAEKASVETRKRTRRTCPDKDYMGGSGCL